jgi:hypothetical protein
LGKIEVRNENSTRVKRKKWEAKARSKSQVRAINEK